MFQGNHKLFPKHALDSLQVFNLGKARNLKDPEETCMICEYLDCEAVKVNAKEPRVRQDREHGQAHNMR